MKLIIVEDESITALFLKKALEKLGHEVVGIYDRAETLFQSLRQIKVDLIFMDIEIKGFMDGIATARELQLHHNIPVVYLTSYKDSLTIQEAMGARPLGYIIKPAMESDIEAIIRVAECRIAVDSPIEIDNKIGPYTFDEKQQTIFKGNTSIQLTKRMIPIAIVLFKNYGRVVSNEYLVKIIQDECESFQENQLRDLVYRLRQKLPKINIVSHSKIGYFIEKSE